MQAEQNAKSEYFGQKAFESAYNTVIETYNVLFTDGYIYGESNKSGNYGNSKMAMAIGGTGAIGDMLSKAPKGTSLYISGNNLGGAGSIYGLFNSYHDLTSGRTNNYTVPDMIVGGVGTSAYAAWRFFGYEIPGVGEVVMCYDGLRIATNIYNNYNTDYTPNGYVPINFTPVPIEFK